MIGGLAAVDRNVISGNIGDGVMLTGSTTVLDLVQGNFIGTDESGESPLGNKGAGIELAGTPGNAIGGPVGGARNVISGNAEGILISGGSAALVAGNFIGTDSSGTAALHNAGAGVSISAAAGTTIGGTTTLARNVISGNTGDGIDVTDGATGTVVLGNYIGLQQTGTAALGNSGAGISVSGSPGTTIGGTADGAGNVISANAESGVSIAGITATSVVVIGNLIGTDKTGASALGNGSFGVLVSGAPGVVIGGTASGSRNVISGNLGAGIGLLAGATAALVQGNLIGTDILGSSPLGNGTGVLIDGGSSNNAIGGTALNAGNTIAFSAGIGVDVDASAGSGNAIRLNSIFSDAGLGIDLGGDGVTQNTPGGPHTGPNDDQNFPVITALTRSGSNTTITGTLNSTPKTSFAIDFYRLPSINASGYGEGQFNLGSKLVTTDDLGNASFTFTYPTPSSGAQFVTATATDPAGNPSEFSQEFGTDRPPTADIGFFSRTVSQGTAITFNGSGSTDPDGDPLTYSWTFGDAGTATGVAPRHTFELVGSDTITLTVNDGLGGTNTATATVVVVNSPPVFVPDSFTPPVSFETPEAGDGFGAGGCLGRRQRCGRRPVRQRPYRRQPSGGSVSLRRRSERRWHLVTIRVRRAHSRLR